MFSVRTFAVNLNFFLQLFFSFFLQFIWGTSGIQQELSHLCWRSPSCGGSLRKENLQGKWNIALKENLHVRADILRVLVKYEA